MCSIYRLYFIVCINLKNNSSFFKKDYNLYVKVLGKFQLGQIWMQATLVFLFFVAYNKIFTLNRSVLVILI
jgi:hypothetical protein